MAAKQGSLKYSSEWQCSRDQGEWPFIERVGGHLSRVAVKRGSTVHLRGEDDP